jgi:hypothetical protein
VRLLIGILSCQRNGARRDACRASWLSAAVGHCTPEVLFVVGVPDATAPSRGGDTLYVPCPDDRSHVWEKTVWLARRAREDGYDALFKCEDDTFAHVGRVCALAAAPGLPDYAGYEVGPGFASGGCLLSRRSIDVLAGACEKDPAPAGEEVAVALRLAAANIPVRHDARFWPWPDRLPTHWNDQVTAHRLPSTDMVALHRALRGDEPRLYRLVEGHSAWGAAGTNGYRGFTADGTAAVRPPAELLGGGGELLSAHATSRLTVETAARTCVTGFLDAGAGRHALPVDFVVDGHWVGQLTAAGTHTPGVVLAAGRHRLEAVASGRNTCRYSAWRLTAAEDG